MLTDTQCRTAKPKDNPYELSDGKGLYLEIKPNEVKRSGSFDLNIYTQIDKCPWGGLATMRSCATAAVVVRC
jgi:hypothetical protein